MGGNNLKPGQAGMFYGAAPYILSDIVTITGKSFLYDSCPITGLNTSTRCGGAFILASAGNMPDIRD